MLRNVNIHMCFETDGKRMVLSFFGSKIRKVSPNERNIASWIKKSIQTASDGKERVQEGIMIRKMNLETFLKEFEGRQIVILKEDGVDVRDVEVDDPIFILGDHLDIPDTVLEIVNKFNPKIVSLGPKSYLALMLLLLPTTKWTGK